LKYTLTFHESTHSDIEDIPANVRKRILGAIESRLLTHPTQYGLRLRQSLASLWKIRVGDYRIVYEISGHQVIIWAILNRKSVYPEVARRWLQ
jgi:mRNA interferase RelE/StbE